MSNTVLSAAHGKVNLIRINPPQAMNTLNSEVVDGIAGYSLPAFGNR